MTHEKVKFKEKTNTSLFGLVSHKPCGHDGTVYPTLCATPILFHHSTDDPSLAALVMTVTNSPDNLVWIVK